MHRRSPRVVAIVGIALNLWAQDRNEERRVLARWVGMVLAVAIAARSRSAFFFAVTS
jgi:hypothetical protein